MVEVSFLENKPTSSSRINQYLPTGGQTTRLDESQFSVVDVNLEGLRRVHVWIHHHLSATVRKHPKWVLSHQNQHLMIGGVVSYLQNVGDS